MNSTTQRQSSFVPSILLLLTFGLRVTAFSISRPALRLSTPLFSSFAADGSEYQADKSDFADDEDDQDLYSNARYREDEDDTPTVELSPVPLSKNAGNRFVAIVWHKKIHPDAYVVDLHSNRVQYTEDHVMFCRKQNLYNQTFNTESMVDIPWSYQMYV